jgi:hypothetical protein
MNPRVFTFWSGPKPNAFIRLCLRSIRKNSPNSELWTTQRWKSVYDNRFGPWSRIAKLKPNLKSDLIRSWLLTTYGGIWIDADCILFRDLRLLWKYIEKGYDMVAYRGGKDQQSLYAPNRGLCSSAMLVANKTSVIMNKYCKLQQQKLLRQKHFRQFNALGPRVLEQAIKRHHKPPQLPIKWIPRKLIHPLTRWKEIKQLLLPEPYQFNSAAFGFMLTHTVIDKMKNRHLRNEKKILTSSLPAGQAFRKALGISILPTCPLKPS